MPMFAIVKVWGKYAIIDPVPWSGHLSALHIKDKKKEGRNLNFSHFLKLCPEKTVWWT